MRYLFAELLVFWVACGVACQVGLPQGAKLLCKDKRKTRSFCVEFLALFDP